MSSRARDLARPVVVAALAVVVVVLVSVWQLSLVGNFRVDDAYITFSFSKNLAHGLGPTFAAGERVEGYSNFLWMVALSIPYLFGATDEIYGFARVLSLACIPLVAWMVFRMARRHAGPVIASLAPLLFLLGTDVYRAALSSLETVPYTAALTAGFFLYLTGDPRDVVRRRYALYAFLGAALVRIDGMIPLAFIVAFELVASIAGGRFRLRAFVRWAAIPLGIYAVYFLWRWWYYGMLLPSTYYAKELANSDPHRGPNYAWGVVRDWGLVAWAPFASLAAWRYYRAGSLVLLSFVTIFVVYIVHVGGDWMPFQRFWIPVFPLVLVWATWGFHIAWDLARGLPRFARGHVLAAIAVAVVFSGVRLNAASVDSPEEDGEIRYAADVIRHTNVELRGDVDFLRAMLRAKGERLVTDYPGIFSVFTDAWIIDMWGLCNATIARRGNADGIVPIYGKTCVACYADFRPDYFHTMTPLVRQPTSFATHDEVIKAVFQGPAIDPVIGLTTSFVTGRVTEVATGRTLWFLERRRQGLPRAPRDVAPGMHVDYPFGD